MASSRNTFKMRDVDKGIDEGQPANGTLLKRNHLSGPLVVDPLSHQLIDTRYLFAFSSMDVTVLMNIHSDLCFNFVSGRIRIFHGVNFVCKAPPW